MENAAWQDVEQNPEYQNLAPDQQAIAHQQYFDQVVAPQVPPTDVDLAKHQFFLDNPPPQQHWSYPAIEKDFPFLKPSNDVDQPHPSMIEDILKPIGRGVAEMGEDIVGKGQAPGSNLNPEELQGLMAASPMSAAGNPLRLSGTVADQMEDMLKGFRGNEGPIKEPIVNPPISKAKERAFDILNETAKEQGISFDQAGAQAKLNAAKGLPMANIDALTQDVDGTTTTMGRGFQALARAAIQRPGEGSGMAAQLASRGNQIKDYLNNFLDKHFSTGDMYKTLDEANAGMTEARPKYEEAMSVAPVYNDKIKMFLNDPDVKAGIPQGIRLQRLEALARGEKPQPYDKAVIDFDEDGNPVIGDVPNMRLIDAAKKGLDAKIQDAQNGRQFSGRATAEERALAGAKTQFLNEVDAVNPAYGEARQAYADPASIAHSSEMGRSWSKMDKEEIERFFTDPETTSAQKAAFKEGARYDMAEKLDKLRDNSTGIDTFWKQDTRNKLQPMMSGNQDSFDSLSNGVNDLRRMAENNQILKGSPTYENLKYGEKIDQKGAPKLLTAIKYANRPDIAAARDLAQFVSERLQKRYDKMSGETSAEILRALTSKDPNALAEVALWGKKNGYK